MSVGRLMDIANRTIQTYQSAIDIASHNIANSGNTNYTRQKVILSAVVAENGAGAGIKLSDIQRIRDTLNDTQIRQYSAQYSNAQTASNYLTQIETLISEPTDNGISNYITSFFNSWSTLTTDPSSTSARSSIIAAAQEVSDRFKEVYDGLYKIKNSVLSEATTKVGQVNTDLKQIASLNKQIYQLEVQGNKANDLKDQRDTILNNLSSLINITVNMDNNDCAVVSVGGIQGADMNNYNEFKVLDDNGKLKIVPTNDSSTGVYLTDGDIAADVDLYSNKIPSYISSYTNLATTFANSVNAIHKTGFTLSNSGASSTNINFFGKSDDSGNWVVMDNGQLIVNQDIIDNSSNIAASDTANNDGNGNIANKIAALSDTKISGLNNQTIIDYYNSILSKVGADKTSNDNTISSSEVILQQLQDQQSSVSGVSMQEEMSNILTYQRGFQAASKIISIADELLQTLIGMLS
jgi:flagellar hook-associated protein 1